MAENGRGTRLLPLEQQAIGLVQEKQRLRAEAHSRLCRSGYHELHFVSCNFHEGVLTLRGRVSSFYLKQVAQTAIRDLDGVGEVNNRLEVVARPGST